MAAGAFPADWTHSDLITIAEHSGSDLVDYQILVELNASNFDFTKAQPDGADIRFAELGGTMLSHWIEAWNSTDENATVWVKVGSVPANGTATIRMWYGNVSAADASDGNATFELFDDFEGISLDTNKWNFSGSGSYAVSGSYIVLDAKSSTSCNRILSQSDISGNYVIETIGCVIICYNLNQYRPAVYWKALPDGSRKYGWDTWGSNINGWVMYNAGHSILGSVSGADISPSDGYGGNFEMQVIVDGNTYTGKEVLRDKIKTVTDSELTGHRVGLGGEKVKTKYDWILVRQYASPTPTITITPDSGNPTTSHIHIDGKNCVNMPFVARLTDTDGNPIASGTIVYSLGGAQFVKTTDASGYSTFTPTTTGTLLAIYGNESVTCEIIDDPTLCTGGCNFGTDPQADDLAITSFTTDKTTYARGETMTITIAVENSAGEMYKKLLIDTSSTKSDTGLPLGFVGSWSFVDIGSSTYEMRLYIPTSTDPGTYNVAGGMYTDYLADGGSILDIASQVSVTIT